MSYRETEHLRVLIANERKDRLALVAPIVVGLGHEVIAREIDVEDVGAVTARERPDVALVGLGESSQHALDLIDKIVREAACPVIVLLHAWGEDASSLLRVAIAVAFLELALAVVGRGDVQRLGRREHLARAAGDHPAGRGDDPAARLGDPALDVDGPAKRYRSLERDRKPGRQAPAVGVDERPGHDLVEDRGDDPAVGDLVPALEPLGDLEVRPAPLAIDVEVEVQATGVQRPAGEAVVGLEREALVDALGDASLRRQDS